MPTSGNASRDPTAHPTHRCGICNKTFDRRDLRDRHKKRCIESFSKPKRSKRRSCHACAASKLGCDLTFPACTRCANRNVICEYPHSVNNGEQNGNLSVTSFAANSEDWSSQMDWNLESDSQKHGFHDRTGGPSHSRTTTGSIVSDIDSIGSALPMTWNAGATDEASTDLIQDLTWTDGIYTNELESPTDNTFNLLGSFGMPGTDSAAISNLNGQSSTFQPILWKPPLPFENVVPQHKHRNPSLYTLSPGDETAITSNVSDMSWQSPQATQAGQTQLKLPPSQPSPAFQGGVNDAKLVKLLTSYMQTMLKKGLYPPFVHPRLYKCIEGDVVESLANAFCSLAAKNAALPSSESFVHLMMNSERSRLVTAFKSWGKSDIEGLAAVHAMSIYQIMGFFDSTSEQARLSELQQPFFLKMARRLAQQYLVPAQNSKPGLSEASWRQWILLESLRRSLLLVNIINNLACRTQKMNAFYYEPLGDELISSLSAPAPDCLWSANSADEWSLNFTKMSAEDQILSSIRIGDLKKAFDPAISMNNSTGLSVDNLSEFTKLTLASLVVETPDD